MALKETRRRQFLADVDDIWLGIAPDNTDAADRLLSRIGRVLSMLLENPRAGRERAELGEGVRSFPVANYVVYYRPGTNRVEFIRIIHGARDITPDDIE